jgi:LysR family transcriptional regulator, low CO2-responsive transcriptional regulator
VTERQLLNVRDEDFMTLYQLKIFEAVARHLNITQAALELHASQPAVSQQLKLLEEHYGASLLARHSHGVKLTYKGRAFLEAIKPVLAQLEDIEHRFKGNGTAGKSQRLAIGGSRNVSVRVLPRLLKAFKESHPSVEFILAANESPVIERHLLNSELDLAVITNPSHIEGLVYEPFDRMEVVAFCIPTNPLAGKTLSLKELAEQPLVLRSGGRIESVLKSQGYRTNFALRCEMSQAVKVAVQTGMGIGIIYRNAIATNIAKGTLKLINVPEFKEMGIKSVMAYDGRKPLSPIARDFLALLRERKERAHKVDERMTSRTSTVSGRERKVTKPQHVSAKTPRKYPSFHPRSAA